MKVLIIDDEEDIREVASLSLSEVGGHDVIEASGGKEGLQKAETESPDVILMDVMMPEMDGPETLQNLKSNPATQGIPVIFLTAKAMTREVDRLKSLGAVGVLVKPFDPLTLANQVTDVLEAN